MNAYRGTASWMAVLGVLGWAVFAWAQSATQPGESARTTEARTDDAGGKIRPGMGTVRGNNVYVRSGSHLHYYPVTKLNRGDKVKIVGGEFGWYKIEPPAGVHSLIEKSLVDRTGDDAGVTNDSAQVYAGSNLEDRRYAKQVRLDKGTRVEIIGETADGAFYKIQPPPGAYLWIKSEFVEREGEDAGETTGQAASPRIERVRPDESVLAPGTTGAAPGSPSPVPSPQPPTLTRPLATLPEMAAPPREPSKFDPEIIAIEAEISAEQAKPHAQRNYAPLIEKLRPLAAQNEDEIARLYAQARIRQLQDHQAIIAAYGQVATSHQITQEEVERIRRQREQIRTEPPFNWTDIVVKGEIRVSTLFSGEAGKARRWRVVDPARDVTLAYIEVPPGSPIDPVQYYGQFVGIRASARRVLSGTNPPTPVYTVQEIVVLDPRTHRAGDMMERMAGPVTTTDPVPLPPRVPGVAAPISPAGGTTGSPAPLVIDLTTQPSP